MLKLVLVMVLVGTASATPMSADRQRVCNARDLEAEDAVRCGQDYLAYYNANPESPNNDEVLYNAAVMFAEGHAPAAALQALGLIEHYYPNSKLAGKALERTAMLYSEMAAFDRAAAAFEQYARKYAGEKDAVDAISDATYFRLHLGDAKLAIDDTNYLIKTYGAKNPTLAANADFALSTVYEGAALVAHLREYLRAYGAKGGIDREVIANAKIGAALWEQSCPVKQVDGLCVKIERTAKNTCASTRSVIVKRDPAKLRDSLAAFAAAKRAYDRVGGKTGGDEMGARYHAGLAMLAAADREFEQLAAPVRGSVETWLDGTRERLARLGAVYGEILTLKDPAISIAVASRYAREQDFTAGQLNAVVGSKPACDAAEPFHTSALAAYRRCVELSVQLGWYDDAVNQCELGDPVAFPPRTELVARPQPGVAPSLEPAIRATAPIVP